VTTTGSRKTSVRVDRVPENDGETQGNDPTSGGEKPVRRGGSYYASLAFVSLIMLGAGIWAGNSLDHWPEWAAHFGIGQEDTGHDESDHGAPGPDEGHAEPPGHAEDDHPGHDPKTMIELSEQGQENVGLSLMSIELSDFSRTVRVPAFIRERPGRSQMAVSAPLTGIVSSVIPIEGEAVGPGTPLFRLRLTHKDLVDTQSAYLQTLEQLDVVRQEAKRLEKITSSGAIAAKRLLEQRYELQKTEAMLRAQRQALILHGLSEPQVNDIVEKRQLLREVTIAAPEHVEHGPSDDHQSYLQVSRLSVTLGQHVEAGARLCTLDDHCRLYVEGLAFEQDAGQLENAATEGLPITAVIDRPGSDPLVVSDLTILYVDNQIERESRTLRFYLEVRNELVRNVRTETGHRFIGWKLRPGQRVELEVPVERWPKRIVLPLGAVVQEGAEWFVFRQNGDHFHRIPVHIEYSDQQSAVIANDDCLNIGDRVAASGAYQLHLAMKNQTGSGVDPHAGHGH